jgi:hypothetical protein
MKIQIEYTVPNGATLIFTKARKPYEGKTSILGCKRMARKHHYQATGELLDCDEIEIESLKYLP